MKITFSYNNWKFTIIFKGFPLKKFRDRRVHDPWSINSDGMLRSLMAKITEFLRSIYLRFFANKESEK